MTRRGVVFFAVIAAFLSLATRAVAHGPPPAATALLGLEGENATIVSLTRGLAHRSEDGFRFLCPERWGGNVAAPAAGIPGGPAVVAAAELFLVEADGRISPHPSQVGPGVALTSSRDALYGIFRVDGHRELRRITQSSSELIRSLDEPFAALAASENELALLSWAESTLVLQKVLRPGELGARVTWSAPSDVAYADLRGAGDQLYAVIWANAAPWVTLGRVTAQGYVQMLEAGGDIAGPLALAMDTWVARDGAFGPLKDGGMVPQPSPHVTCLGSYLGLDYACVDGDLVRVEEDGLGASLFELTSLREPNYEGLSEAARTDCMARWLDVQIHLASAAASGGAADASTPAVDTTQRDDGPSMPNGAGCTLGLNTTHACTRHAWWLSAIALAALFLLRRRPAHPQ